MKVFFSFNAVLLVTLATTPAFSAQCNDSFSVTASSITINWNVNACKNLKSIGEKFRICWHQQGTVGFICSQPSRRFISHSNVGSYTISGLSPSTSYRVKTSYRRANWDEVSERYISTNAAQTTNKFLNVSTAQSNGCRTFTWAGLQPLAGNIRELNIQHRVSKFGVYSGTQTIDVTNVQLSGGVYVLPKCGFLPSRSYRVFVGNRNLVGSSYTDTTNTVTFW